MELGHNVLWFEEGATSYFVQPPPDFNTTQNPWKPAVVSDLKPFRKAALRMMDAGMTNRNNVSRWADRRQKGDADQTPDWSPQGSRGVAYEWMVLLCNEVGINCWVNVSCRTVSATDGFALPDYALRMALLIKTGVDMGALDLAPLLPKLSEMDTAALVAAGGRRTGVALDPSLRLHVELGNEMWWEPECKNYSTGEGHGAAGHVRESAQQLVCVRTAAGHPRVRGGIRAGEQDPLPTVLGPGRQHLAGR